MKFGLTFKQARVKLLEAMKSVASERHRPVTLHDIQHVAINRAGQLLATHYLGPSLILLFYSWSTFTEYPSFRPGVYIAIAFIVIISTASLITNLLWESTLCSEVHSYILNVISKYESHLERIQEGNAQDLSTSSCNEITPSILTGHSQISIVNVYRGNHWIKVPVMLLVEGDIIALMNGDMTPCKVSELKERKANSYGEKKYLSETEWDISTTLGKGLLIKEGCPQVNENTISGKHPNSPLTGNTNGNSLDANSPHQSKSNTTPSNTKHRLILSDSAEILRLGGNVKCYLVRETPVVTFIEEIYQLSNNNSSSPRESNTISSFFLRYFEGFFRTSNCIEENTLIRRKQKILGRYTSYFVCCSLIVGGLVFILRSVIRSNISTQSELMVSVNYGNLLLVFIPIASNIYSGVVDILATSEILMTLETTILGISDKRENNGNKKRHFEEETVQHNISALNSMQNKSAANVDEFIDDDLDVRVEDIASQTATQFRYHRLLGKTLFEFLHFVILILHMKLLSLC